MDLTNKEMLKKVDMFTADLDGGLLTGDQATAFIRSAIDKTVIQKFGRTVTLDPISGGKHTLPRLAFNSRLLRRAQEGIALSESQRSKASIDSVTFESFPYVGEVRLSYKTLKRNIEHKGIEKTIKDAMAERIMLDVDDLVMNANESSTDDYYKDFDGMRASAGNSVDCGAITYGTAALKKILTTMPSKYKKRKNMLAHFCSTASEENYRDELTDRATVLGDKMLEGNNSLYYNSSRVLDVPVIPEDLTGTKTEAIFTDPRNIMTGWEQQVQFEVAKDISARMLIIVATVWVGFTYEDPNAVVKGTNLVLT
jgi:hypothetical protein